MRRVVIWPPLILIWAILDVGIFTFLLPAGLVIGLQFLFTILGVIIGYRKDLSGI